MGEERTGLEVSKWDKLESWSKVQEEISKRLRNAEKYDDSMTLYYGPQLYHTFRHPAKIKCMTHFTSNVGEVFVSHYRLGTQDQLSVWSLNSMERGAKSENQRFDINGEIKAFLFIPKHRAYMCFCSDLVMRIYTDTSSNCTETSSLQCLSTVRCMAYNRETDDIYVGGIGVLQKWKVTGSEHSATAEPGPMFDTDLGKDEWIIDIKVDTRNHQLIAVSYEGIFVVNYKTMKQTHHLQSRHDNSLRCCCFYKDKEYFITGGGDGTVKVWNAVVFTQVHVFYGHRDVITGLQTHKTDPLLFSSSLDGSVQIWRMDNFSKFMRLDLGENIYSMKLIVDEEFYCQTESQIRIYSLNQFYSLFAPVESSVYKLQLCSGANGQPSRIIASTEDGSVRLFSPVTGATLTIIYPMPTFQVLSCFAYSRKLDQLHSVLQNGEVLIFDCGTNPCKAVEVWTSEVSDEEVLQLVQLTLEYEKDDAKVTDTVILGGLRNGQICLLDASQCVLIKNIQAHEGNITCMENATDIGETGFKLLETSRKMATGGDDAFIKIWELGVISGRLYDNIDIQLVLKIPCSGVPNLISMYENTISVSTSDDTDKGKLHMYRMDGQKSSGEIQYTTLQHTQDEDHTEHISAIDKCPLLGLFATASEDGYIKIWNRHNQLIREMGFGEPMHGLCFANKRGDILIGFQSHICTIPLTSYFPKNYLERITRQEFKDEPREKPIAYNHGLQAWTDPSSLPQYSISYAQRTEEKKEEDILEDLEVTPRVGREDCILEEQEGVEDITELPAITKQQPPDSEPAKSVNKAKTKPRVQGRKRRESTGALIDRKQDFKPERGLSAPAPEKKSRLERMKEEQKKIDSLYLSKLSPWERDLFKRKTIIAPDGYIPNSVVRKSLGYVPPPSPLPKQDTWTIESIKLPPSAKPVVRKQTYEEEDHQWEEVKAQYLQFLDESSDDEIDTEISQPPPYAGRPNNGRGRGKKAAMVIDSDDDDLELDDSEAVEDSDIFENSNDYEIIKPVSKKKKVKARYLQFLGDSSESDNNSGDSSSSDDDDLDTVSKPPRPAAGGQGRPRNLGVGRGKKKAKVIDSDDDDLDFDDSEPVDDTDIFPPGFEYEIGQSLVGGPLSMLPPGSDLKGIKPFTWGENEAEESKKSSSYAPWKKMQTMIRASSTLSNVSTSSSKRGLSKSRKSTPTTPYELKSKKFEFHRVDLDLGTPDRMRRSVGTRSRERTKSFRLTNMVVDEQSTNVTFKGDSRGHRKGMLPAVDMDIIRRLMEEEFFVDVQESASFDSIMQNLIRLLDTDDTELHGKICDYLISIHSDIGIPDHYLDRIIGKLTFQLNSNKSGIKLDALYTLQEIGKERQDVIASILPRLIDAEDNIREAAQEVLAVLNGTENKDELMVLLNSLGMTKPFNSKEDEKEALKGLAMRLDVPFRSEQEEALKGLAMRLDVPFRSDSFTDWINNWVDDASSIYESEPEINFDDVEKAWDGRQKKWKQESLCMTDVASRASTRLRELSFLSKGSRTPIPEENEQNLDRINVEAQLSDRSTKSRGSERFKVRFDPRDPNLYKYYKNRFNKDKDNVDGKFNYKSMSKLFSKSQLSGGEDADSQIGSSDSYSQGDALSVNESGVMSMQDSGIGRDISDTYSIKSHRTAPFLSKEKPHSHVKGGSLRSSRKHNLSPVKSSSTVGGLSAKSSPRERDPTWMKFLETPTALERKRMELVKREFNEGKMKPSHTAVINYISDGLPMLPGEAGLRLLKSVRVGSDKGHLPEKHHQIESIPGKLGIYTKAEDKGQANYGILQMQWTTAIPAPKPHDHAYSERYSSMSDATSTLGGSTINTYRSKRPLPAIVHKYGNSERLNASHGMEDFYSPRIPGGVYTPDYEWDYPIPPPPPKESRISEPYIKKEHDRYCSYYTKLMKLKRKKGINSADKTILPSVDIKKALPERLKLPKEMTKLSRVASILFPPITLNQLISAR